MMAETTALTAAIIFNVFTPARKSPELLQQFPDTCQSHFCERDSFF